MVINEVQSPISDTVPAMVTLFNAAAFCKGRVTNLWNDNGAWRSASLIGQGHVPNPSDGFKHGDSFPRSATWKDRLRNGNLHWRMATLERITGNLLHCLRPEECWLSNTLLYRDRRGLQPRFRFLHKWQSLLDQHATLLHALCEHHSVTNCCATPQPREFSSQWDHH